MPKKFGPIKPNEVVKKKSESIPKKVFDAFNELISKEISVNSATFKQKEVVKLIVKKGLSEKKIFDNNWLDVEEAYENAGWRVEYDGPGFNETYDATFTFTKRNARR